MDGRTHPSSRPFNAALISVLLAWSASAQTGSETDAAGRAPLVVVGDEAFDSWQAYVESNTFLAQGLRCGLDPRHTRVAELNELRAPSDCAYSSTNPSPQYEPSGGIVYQIPVVFHVLYTAPSVGNMSRTRIEEQVEILNEDFRALAGTNGAGGTDTRIEFYLATVDPNGNATSGVTRTQNTNWFNDNGSYWNTLAWDTNRYLNVYTNTASGALGYVPNIPQGGLVGSKSDRVVVLYSTIGRNGNIGPPFNQGRTLTHEVGHYLGLEHTFSGGCAPASSCYVNGDLICDTNPEQSPTSGCPGFKSSCGTSDPIENYMDYSDDLCMYRFTPEQANRMRCTLENWRPDLHTPRCAGAPSVSTRNAGSNPAVYTASLPVLGAVQTFSVSTGPYSLAYVFGQAGAVNLTLSGGQVALVDLGSPRYFRLGPLAGPNASTQVSLPLDPMLCGVQVHTQAVLLGGTTPFALTNAVDMTAGN